MPFYSGHKSFWQAHVVDSRLSFALLPQRCHISNKLIWLEDAYKQTARWTGPGHPIYETRWYDKHEFLIAQLKGEV